MRIRGVDAVLGLRAYVGGRWRRVGAKVGAELVVFVARNWLGGMNSPSLGVVSWLGILDVIVIQRIRCTMRFVVAFVVVFVVCAAPLATSIAPQPLVGFGPRAGSQRLMRRRCDVKLSSDRLSNSRSAASCQIEAALRLHQLTSRAAFPGQARRPR